MKTTLDLPDDLMRAVKIRAINEHRKLGAMIAELLRRGLRADAEHPGGIHTRVRLPLVQCAHAASAGTELTPARVADALLEQEARELVPGHDPSVRQ